MFFYAIMLSWWDFFWQSFFNLVMHVSSMNFVNDNIVSWLHKISMCMFSQPTSHRLDTSEFNMWCSTIHFIQCEPEKLKIRYPLFQPSCISMGDRMSLLDRFTVTDISQGSERPGNLPKGTHCWLYVIALPLCPALIDQNGLCCVCSDGTWWGNVSWETDDCAWFHTRCWEPYTNFYLSVVAPPHRNWYNQTCTLLAGERVYLREYTFRWHDAWTIPSHSPPAQTMPATLIK